MKKYSILLLSLLISSCGNVETPSENKQSEEVKTVESSTLSEDITRQVSFDKENRTQKDFFNIQEIYLNDNETYDLAKMVKDGINLENISYLSLIPNNISVSNKGILQGLSHDGKDEVRGKLVAYDATNYQEIDISIVDYEEYGNYFMSVDKGRLYGKNVMFFGDSITHNWAKYPNGDTTVVNNTTSLGYNYIPILKNECNLNNIINAAWSGGTMAYLPSSAERFVYKSFPGCVDDHFDEIKDMDYIFVFYGTNDLTEQVTIGNDVDKMQKDQKQAASFKASMKYGIERIREASKDARIIFINLLFRTYQYSGTITPENYNEAIDDLCKAYMCKLLDVSKLFNRSNMAIYSKDGLHPNEKGYRVLADYMMYGMDGVKYE